MKKKFLLLIVLLWTSQSVMATHDIDDKKSGLEIASQNSLHQIETIVPIPPQGVEKDFFPLTSKNSNFQGLFNLVYGYLDFCEDSLANFRKASYFDTIREIPSVMNVTTAIKMIARVNEIDAGTITIDAFLQECLWGRLLYIQDRALAFSRTKQMVVAGLKPENYIIPTTPQALEMLKKKQDMIGEDKFADYRLALESISRYQFMNALIAELFRLSTPSKLSKKTKEYISCSRTLWPILQGKTTDLSYPDAATITYDEDPDELQDHKDYNYFWSNYDLQSHTVKLMNWCRKDQIFQMSRQEILEYEGGDYFPRNARLEILALPRPNWLYPEKEKKIAQVGETSSSSTRIQLPNAPAKSQQPIKRGGKGKKVLPKRLVVNHKTDSNTLVSVAQSSDSKHIDQEQNEISLGGVLENQAPSENVFSTASSTALIVEPLKIETEQVSSDTIETPDFEGLIEESLPFKTAESLSSESDAPICEEIPSQNIIEASLLPRGMRVYHTEKRALEEQPIPVLTGKIQKLVETIFDYRAHGQGFNFGEFRHLWESINGKDTVRCSGSGSSHYALLNREGQVVTGTFAHGDNQQYTRSTVRYLRAALNAIGIKNPYQK